MDMLGRETHVTLHPCPPTPAYQSSFLKRVALFWGSKPWTTDTAKGEFWHCVGEKWGSAFGIFLLKKRENKKKYRTVSAWPDGKDCGRPHTHTHSHIHSCMSHSGPR